ncbi:hypothetical protein KA075_02495 [Candidatus Saccharibacteria bacterium]|jgi:hypothetical protein|nr:hypothetical protein [Candidatus Saccharibacteria bacterium]
MTERVASHGGSAKKRDLVKGSTLPRRAPRCPSDTSGEVSNQVIFRLGGMELEGESQHPAPVEDALGTSAVQSGEPGSEI